MAIIAHTMQYMGNAVPVPDWNLRTYSDADYPAHRTAYNDCFSDMRRALHLSPVYCCPEREVLFAKAKDIFVLETAGELTGSVAIYGNEIDDLFVRKVFQGKGYGQGLLRFAVARMQRGGVSPITLHVADWNQDAVKLYKKNGFQICETQVIR